MKFLFLLAAFIFVAGSAEVIVVKYHLDETCDDSSLSQLISQSSYKLGCNNGIEKYVSGDYLKARAYSRADCTGTASSVITNILELNKCKKISGDSKLHSKAISMSDADFDGYQKMPGNVVIKPFDSDNCTGTQSYLGILVNTIKGKCLNTNGNDAVILSWDDTKMRRKSYTTSDCSGTVTEKEEDRMNVCLNKTDSNRKRSEIYSVIPATSSAVRLTSLKSAMVFGIIFLTSCLY